MFNLNQIASNVLVIETFTVIGVLTILVVFSTLALISQNQPRTVKVKKS